MVEKKHGKLSSLRIEEILEPFEIHLDTGGNSHVNNTENSGELAGISRPACLMFLNNPDPPHLSAAKKEELAALIHRYQYRSNWAARSLRGKKLQLARAAVGKRLPDLAGREISRMARMPGGAGFVGPVIRITENHDTFDICIERHE